MRAIKNLFIAVLLAFFTIVPANASFAHTDVAVTTPADGSTVKSGLLDVTVSFNDAIVNLDGSSQIIVTDTDGTEVIGSCVVVDKKVLTKKITVYSAGVYNVAWRTVAEDGHPISGKFSFTAEGDYEGGDDYPSCAATDTDNGKYPVATVPSTNKTTAGSDPTLWLILGGLLVVLATVGYSIWRLKRRSAKV